MFTIETLLEELPHGSGINGDWHFKTTSAYTHCTNTYYPINDVGMYDGSVDFDLMIPVSKDPMEFKLQFNGTGSQYLARKYSLREYLEDLFAEALREMVKKHS